MGTDGSGDRKLFNRDPAGCKHVIHASWSLADPNVMLISCEVSKNKDGFLVVGMDGRLIRRLDAGDSKVIGDFGISPDGQTVLYWASDTRGLDGGALYTLPLIGTGDPKQLTDSADGVDADPAWSPDSTQIAFRRRVPNGTAEGNFDVYVMNANGSGEREVSATPADDFKPIWSPDSKNLLIISNRKSAGRPRGLEVRPLADPGQRWRGDRSARAQGEIDHPTLLDPALTGGHRPLRSGAPPIESATPGATRPRSAQTRACSRRATAAAL